MRKTKEQNSKHQIPNTNKGVTLIALVITIIVMLILVAVTISMAVNGGLFDFARRAATETENAINKEQLLAEGKIEIDGTWYNSIDEYVNSTPEVHNWTRSGDTFTCSHCNTTYTMGDVINYTPNGKTSTTISAQMSGLDKYYTNQGSYPSSASVDENGNQTIEAQETTWVVLGMEDTNGNGTYETLLITTETPLTINGEGQSIFLYGAAAYNNGPDELNRICKELYSNSKTDIARSMTVEDVNRALNYSPAGAEYFLTNSWYTTGNLTTKLKDLDIFEEMVADGTYTPDGKNTEEALGEYVLNYYGYELTGMDNLTIQNRADNKTTTITETQRDVIFGNANEFSYMLADSLITVYQYGSTVAKFGLYSTSSGGVGMYHYSYFNSDGESVRYCDYLRPVVSLASELPTATD